MKNFLNSTIRFLKSLRRPSKKANLHKLRGRGETMDSFSFRDAVPEDVPALGKLHAITWMETYGGKRPNIALRQSQWRQTFAEKNNGSWFCMVIADKKSELIGFARGIIHLNEKTGEINKIYLLREYQRLGLGKQLMAMLVKRFLVAGVNQMYLFGIPQNPSCYFHEAMGGIKIYSEKGSFDGGYQWADLDQWLQNFNKQAK